MLEALVGLGAFLLLAFLRVPMAFSMGIVGFCGVAYMLSFNAAAAMIGQITYETGLSYTLSVIPLFILMGNFATKGGISKSLFEFAASVMGGFKGGLAMAAVLACAAFGAICGSSVATAATITGVAMPELYLADALGAAGKPMIRVHTAGSVGGSTAIVAAKSAVAAPTTAMIVGAQA